LTSDQLDALDATDQQIARLSYEGWAEAVKAALVLAQMIDLVEEAGIRAPGLREIEAERDNVDRHLAVLRQVLSLLDDV
jgi:hypothetical protein